MTTTLYIIDTCIFTNILDLPGLNQDAQSIKELLVKYMKQGCSFTLPMATILETGNHIAQLADGNIRRKKAEEFTKFVSLCFNNTNPWELSDFPRSIEVSTWLDGFPDRAQQKLSFGDLSIVELFNLSRLQSPQKPVKIWTLDRQLNAYNNH
jgi:hypothetical protein